MPKLDFYAHTPFIAFEQVQKHLSARMQLFNVMVIAVGPESGADELKLRESQYR